MERTAMKTKIFALAALAALALTACSSPGGGDKVDSKHPFTVVFIAGVTGNQASTAASEKTALEAAVKEINDGGGILGRKVVIESYDSKSDPTEAVTVLNKRLASGTKPDLVRAGLSSGETLALAPLLTREKIPAWTSAANPAAGDSKAYPYLKLVVASATRTGEAGRTYIESTGIKKLDIFASEDAAGDGIVAAQKELYKDTGIAIKDFRYSTNDVDLTVAYQRVVDDKPDAIYMDSASEPLTTRLLIARNAVTGAAAIPVLSGSGTSSTLTTGIATVPASAIADFRATLFRVQLALPASEQTKEYKAFHEALGDVDNLVAPSAVYDGMRMWAAAAEKAKSTDAQKMVDAINNMDWKPGFFVTYGNAKLDYDDTTNFPLLPDNAYAIVQISKPVAGQFQPLDLYPPK